MSSLPERAMTIRTFREDAPITRLETPRSLVGAGECAVYRFYDIDGDLLYVGVAWNPHRRWSTHRRAEWWQMVRRVEVDVYRDEVTALAVERAWIRNAMPRFNVRSAVR